MLAKKLIEVALPLEKINAESAREKSIRHGHPSTLHLWWARRPLAAARAVIWSSLVDDPSSHPEKFPTEEEQTKERQRLFKILEELVVWENSSDERVLSAAKEEILKSTNGNPPELLDPFAGGGSIPLREGGDGARAYGEAVGVYLAFAVDRKSDFCNCVCRWSVTNEKPMNLFARQAIPMVWDFPEVNVFSNSVGGFLTIVDYVSKCINTLLDVSPNGSNSKQFDAQSDCGLRNIMISTDPPYYDNIGYADLSDFFYIWMRRSLKDTYPELFNTLLVPMLVCNKEAQQTN